jgi:hypothetical protein
MSGAEDVSGVRVTGMSPDFEGVWTGAVFAAGVATSALAVRLKALIRTPNAKPRAFFYMPA